MPVRALPTSQADVLHVAAQVAHSDPAATADHVRCMTSRAVSVGNHRRFLLNRVATDLFTALSAFEHKSPRKFGLR